MKQNKQLTNEQYHQMMKEKYLKHDPELMQLAEEVMNNQNRASRLISSPPPALKSEVINDENDQKLVNINLTKLKQSQEKRNTFFSKHPELSTKPTMSEKRRNPFAKDKDNKNDALKKQELLAKLREEKKDQQLLDSLNNIAENNNRLNYTLKMKKITPEDLKRTKNIRSHQDYYDVSKRYKRFDPLINKIFIATNISLGLLITLFILITGQF